MADLESELFQLAMSDKAQPLMDAVQRHITDNVEPITEEFYALQKGKEPAEDLHRFAPFPRVSGMQYRPN